jgi:hypothetical protein
LTKISQEHPEMQLARRAKVHDLVRPALLVDVFVALVAALAARELVVLSAAWLLLGGRDQAHQAERGSPAL